MSPRQPYISADAGSVAFISDASNLVVPIGYGSAYLLWDAALEDFELISDGAIPTYGKALAISADGGQVAFRTSLALNPGDSHRFGPGIYHWERASGTYTLVTKPLAPWLNPNGSASPWFRNGDTVLLQNTANLILESFVLTDQLGAITYIRDLDYTLTSDGGDYSVNRLPGGDIPAGFDGRTQATFSTTEYGVNGDSTAPSISPDGRFVGFSSFAKNMVEGDGGPAGDSDGFVWDRDLDEVEKLSWNTSGEQADGGSFEIDISSGAGFAAFTSDASDLVEGDTDDGKEDLFLGAPCIGVPEPALGLLQMVAVAGVLGLRSSRGSRSARQAQSHTTDTLHS